MNLGETFIYYGLGGFFFFIWESHCVACMVLLFFGAWFFFFFFFFFFLVWIVCPLFRQCMLAIRPLKRGMIVVVVAKPALNIE